MKGRGTTDDVVESKLAKSKADRGGAGCSCESMDRARLQELVHEHAAGLALMTPRPLVPILATRGLRHAGGMSACLCSNKLGLGK